MKEQKSFLRLSILAGIFFPLLGAACAPPVYRPTLEETRSGRASTVAPDVTIRPGETRAEIEQVDPVRGKIRFRLDNGRVAVLNYDAATQVVYQGRSYDVRNLEAGDVVAVRIPGSNDYVSYITVQETVQDRIARGTLQRSADRPNTIEGIVEDINRDRGVLDLRLDSGRIVTVTLPYNARSVDVENFRRLRRGDVVRLEGDFVSPSTFQLYAFRAP